MLSVYIVSYYLRRTSPGLEKRMNAPGASCGPQVGQLGRHARQWVTFRNDDGAALLGYFAPGIFSQPGIILLDGDSIW